MMDYSGLSSDEIAYNVQIEVFFEDINKRIINAIQLSNESNIGVISTEIESFINGNEPISINKRNILLYRLTIFYQKLIYYLHLQKENFSYPFFDCSKYNTEAEWDECFGRLKMKIESSLMELFTAKVKKQTKYNSLMIEKCKEYIGANLYNDLSLSGLADKIMVHPNYLSKIFKETAGINFIEYITIQKMDEAKKMLKQTDLRVNEIANYLNYRDKGYFSKMFKKKVGVSPTEYRQLIV